MERRPTIPRPIFAKDLEMEQLERAIRQNVERLAEIAPAVRLTHYWHQLTHILRAQGALLPGDGRGGLIQPKGKLDGPKNQPFPIPPGDE